MLRIASLAIILAADVGSCPATFERDTAYRRRKMVSISIDPSAPLSATLGNGASMVADEHREYAACEANVATVSGTRSGHSLSCGPLPEIPKTGLERPVVIARYDDAILRL
ncbi:hypothetical protein [Bradyrhizobium sp. WSM3983]|uniref:hypothetical protein n=1 Tax=Bradyrhizobium sp. WSM3983 TaxID=1038867 RepID=UPI0012EBA9C4|nr:hypothetical protein [Bradyrhizobium sp. WSM3983]